METVTSLLTHYADYWRDIAELLGSGHLLEEIYSIHKTDEACLRALVERQVEEQTLSDDELQDIIGEMKGIYFVIIYMRTVFDYHKFPSVFWCTSFFSSTTRPKR